MDELLARIPDAAATSDYPVKVVVTFGEKRLPRVEKPVVLSVISVDMLGNLMPNGGFERPNSAGTWPEGFGLSGKNGKWAPADGLHEGLGSLDAWNKICPIPLIGRSQLTYQAPGYAWTPDNLSAVAYLNWDAANLYVAVSVRDEAHQPATTASPSGDAILQLNDSDGKGLAAQMNWGGGLTPTWNPLDFGIVTLAE